MRSRGSSSAALLASASAASFFLCEEKPLEIDRSTTVRWAAEQHLEQGVALHDHGEINRKRFHNEELL